MGFNFSKQGLVFIFLKYIKWKRGSKIVLKFKVQNCSRKSPIPCMRYFIIFEEVKIDVKGFEIILFELFIFLCQKR